MKRIVLSVLLASACAVPTQAAPLRERLASLARVVPLRERWASFCARHLVAEHPYQKYYKTAPISQVVEEYRRLSGLVYWKKIDKYEWDEYEMTLSILADRVQGELTREDRMLIEDAIRDYPDPRLSTLLP